MKLGLGRVAPNSSGSVDVEGLCLCGCVCGGGLYIPRWLWPAWCYFLNSLQVSHRPNPALAIPHSIKLCSNLSLMHPLCWNKFLFSKQALGQNWLYSPHGQLQAARRKSLRGKRHVIIRESFHQQIQRSRILPRAQRIG